MLKDHQGVASVDPIAEIHIVQNQVWITLSYSYSNEAVRKMQTASSGSGQRLNKAEGIAHRIGSRLSPIGKLA